MQTELTTAQTTAGTVLQCKQQQVGPTRANQLTTRKESEVSGCVEIQTINVFFFSKLNL